MNPDEQKFYKTFLSDVEIDAVSTVAGKALVLGALKKIVLADVYFKGTLRADIDADPTRNAALSLALTKTDLPNEILGQDIRALSEAIRLVEGGFNRIVKFKPAETPPKGGKGNRAR